MTPEEMWAKFIEELNKQQPLKDEARHTSFLGSIAAYRKIFLTANKDSNAES